MTDDALQDCARPYTAVWNSHDPHRCVVFAEDGSLPDHGLMAISEGRLDTVERPLGPVAPGRSPSSWSPRTALYGGR